MPALDEAGADLRGHQPLALEDAHRVAAEPDEQRRHDVIRIERLEQRLEHELLVFALVLEAERRRHGQRASVELEADAPRPIDRPARGARQRVEALGEVGATDIACLRHADTVCSRRGWGRLDGMSTPALAPAAAARGFSGEILTEESPDYDRARVTFNALIDRRPLAIARCRSTEDVAIALATAGEHELPVAVRGGGHNVAGHAVCDGGLVVDLSGLGDVEVDPDARVARAGGGALWRTFDAAAQAHGLAVPGGTFATTGVGGLTLGGGIGFLIGRLGLTCDSLVAAEVVTVDGDVIVASEDDHADLFWALRGGGGNFGVVTRLDFTLHPMREVVGGFLVYAYDTAREASASSATSRSRRPTSSPSSVSSPRPETAASACSP